MFSKKGIDTACITRCTVPCSGGLYIEKSTSDVRYFCGICGKEKLLLLPKAFHGGKDEETRIQLSMTAGDAMDSRSPQNTMREITQEEVEKIYRNLWA